jgi:hypothetical protein
MSSCRKSVPSAQCVQAKKRYAKPRFEALGDVRDLTLGPSPGSGESGTPRTHKNPHQPGPASMPWEL